MENIEILASQAKRNNNKICITDIMELDLSSDEEYTQRNCKRRRYKR